MPNILEKIYCDIDSLLDTRIGTLSLLNKDVYDKALMSDMYHSRDEDVFDGIDKEEFIKTYSKRNINTLANSIITNIFPLLNHLIDTLTKESINNPYFGGIELVVNYYPYELSIDDQQELIKVITLLLNGYAKVNLIKINLKQLTPIHCKGNYKIMVMYSYFEWLVANAELFITTQLPEITLFVPALYFNNKPSDEKLEELIKECGHPFGATEMFYSGIISLNIIDVKYFSIINTA
jgi:hypothetical protein